MYFNLLKLRTMQRTIGCVLLIVLTTFYFSFSSYASPGAHGPNGEHLDTQREQGKSSYPKFESVTEFFELVGELIEHQLVIYLHDFKTNVPVSDASIELEVGNLSANAHYSEQLNAYILTSETMLTLLSQVGSHEIMLTVLTESSGDLLTANLEIIAKPLSDLSHGDGHHHKFRWWIVVVCILVFVGGLLFGRQTKGAKA
ncbi:hypothetical protein N475_14725 [Pseudoalteromonas luteoviolacea DSM 6061]|uniref:Uncharacterized protein n=2 Tax=Pseudoalteromonas luteoviolacea TaxID=43657 RepID=A0A161XXJ6_9GAMM|nr:hypothetical protein N475_14725 [Pseudoalteromonas luteoviolacea DSM 6061]MBE0389955.1 hypothetical protein [Pseudoalteromonas luteoviolacea DSM 6061]